MLDQPLFVWSWIALAQVSLATCGSIISLVLLMRAVNVHRWLLETESNGHLRIVATGHVHTETLLCAAHLLLVLYGTFTLMPPPLDPAYAFINRRLTVMMVTLLLLLVSTVQVFVGRALKRYESR